MEKVDLGKYRGANSRVFSGREEGKNVRKRLSMDLFDQKRQEITFIIPRDTLSLNTSFFLGLFGNSVRNLGEEDFRKFYYFDCNEIIQKSIDDGIARALKNSNSLG